MSSPIQFGPVVEKGLPPRSVSQEGPYWISVDTEKSPWEDLGPYMHSLTQSGGWNGRPLGDPSSFRQYMRPSIPYPEKFSYSGGKVDWRIDPNYMMIYEKLGSREGAIQYLKDEYTIFQRNARDPKELPHIIFLAFNKKNEYWAITSVVGDRYDVVTLLDAFSKTDAALIPGINYTTKYKSDTIWKAFLRIIINLCERVKIMHRAGYFVGNIDPKDVWVVFYRGFSQQYGPHNAIGPVFFHKARAFANDPKKFSGHSAADQRLIDIMMVGEMFIHMTRFLLDKRGDGDKMGEFAKDFDLIADYVVDAMQSEAKYLDAALEFVDPGSLDCLSSMASSLLERMERSPPRV